MRDDSPRWHEVNRSEFLWEREGLQHVKARLPDTDPYHAWPNVEFVGTDGSINEIDLLVLTPSGLHLVELKHWVGRVRGNGMAWKRSLPNGKTRSDDNPLLLTNRKAKRLRSLLEHYGRQTGSKTRAPYVKAAVLLHAKEMVSELDEVGQTDIFGLEDHPKSNLPGLVSGLLTRAPNGGRDRLDAARARQIVKLIDSCGIRPSVAGRSVGRYELVPGPIAEGVGWQDYLALHKVDHDVASRVRFYLTSKASAEDRATIERAAQREFRLLYGVNHPGLAKAVDLVDHEFGPAVIFEHDQTAVRLDHFIADRAEFLAVEERLDLVRTLAETLRYAHARHLTHRSLSPRSILIRKPDSAKRYPVVIDWQSGGRDGSSTGQASILAGTSHPDRLVDATAQPYLAPESLTHPDTDGTRLDIFGLGALAYLIFTGQAPASNASELRARLEDQGGLDIDATTDGVPTSIQELVWEATQGDPAARFATVEAFLAQLSAVEEELTRPDTPDEEVVDPLDARPSDRLGQGLTVVRRLGAGATAVALLVKQDGDDREFVLKVARDEDKRRRLLDEAEVLRPLTHWQVAKLIRGPLVIGGRTALLLESAGDRTLAEELRASGRLTLESLERYGKDLLDIVAYLDGHGVTHRDIKPDNLAYRPRPRDKQRHLTIFDFSLANAPAERIDAGTPRYLDPFLSKSKRPLYDTSAELFAVGVTLYELATGVLPEWGDSGSHPGMVDCEVTVARGRLDPAVADPLSEFFARALAREVSGRFESIEEMTRAWMNAFHDLDASRTGSGVDPAAGSAKNLGVTLDTPLIDTGLTAKALSALERFDVETVDDLLAVNSMELGRQRGVSRATRLEIERRIRDWRQRLGKAAAPTVGKPDQIAEPQVHGIDSLVLSLVPGSNGRNGLEIRTVRVLLGLEDKQSGTAPQQWPSQAEIAAALNVTAGRVNQIVGKVRSRWLKEHDELGNVRNDLIDLLDASGGVMTALELAEGMVTLRGTFADEPLRTAQALGLVRAAVDAELERGGDARMDLRRAGKVVLIAREGDDPAAEPASLSLDYAAELGRLARSLASEDPLPGAGRVIERLRGVAVPEEAMAALDDARIVQLAASASGTAAVSGQHQLYPIGLDPERAIRMAAGSLVLGHGRTLTVANLHKRVLARFPRAAELPERPQLDRLLARAGVGLEWNGDVYVSPTDPTLDLLSSATQGPTQHVGVVAPDDLELVEQRLQTAVDSASFLAVTVSLRGLAAARVKLLTLPGIAEVDVTAELIAALRGLNGVAWDLVIRSDALDRSHPDRRSLELAVRQVAVPRIRAAIAGALGPVLLTEAAPLARYGCMDLLAHLADPTPGRSGACMLLVPSETDSRLPVLDDEAVPVMTAGQVLRLPSAWYSKAA